MGKDPSDIRAELEETRGRVGEEVDALSYKTDVGARVGDKLSGAKEAVLKPVPSRRQLREVRYTAERNPLGLALGGAAVGFVVGLLLPSTRIEDEKLGPASQRLGETAGDAFERGKEVAREAGESAVETAKERGREEGEQLASTLQDRVPRGEEQHAR